MGIPSNQPQIFVLRKRVETRFGKQLSVHTDFVALSAEIEACHRQHISESTLERVWTYSTRGYRTVSLRTLDVLAAYADSTDWATFCETIRAEADSQSELFECRAICADDLSVGDRLRIGWLPDRVCEIRYLGGYGFVAEHCENAKMQPGDTFRCLEFQVGQPLSMQDFRHGTSDLAGYCYLVGRQDGLTQLEIISSDNSRHGRHDQSRAPYGIECEEEAITR